MRNTWRFNFAVENNSSSAADDTSTAAIGFTVARAEKGTVTPYYFPVGSEQEIRIMCGDGGIDYPDIEEAIYFNNSHPVYISTPAGGNSASPSYFGGIYITKYGIYKFYKVTDKDAPNYLANVGLDELSSQLNVVPNDASGNAATASKSIVINTTKDSGYDSFTMKNISKAVYNLMTKVTLNFGGTIYEYYIDKDKNTLRYYTDGEIDSSSVAGIVITPDTSASTHTDNGTYTIVIGGDTATSNDSYPRKAYEAFTIPAFDGVANTSTMMNKLLSTDADLLKLIWNAATTKYKLTYTNDAGTTITKRYNITVENGVTIGMILDLTGSVHEYICQKSPTSKVTTLAISNIGYDRWYYDHKMEYIAVTDGRATRMLANETDTASAYYANDKQFFDIEEDTPVVVYFKKDDEDEDKYCIFERRSEDYIDETSGEYLSKLVWTDITSEYNSLVIQISGPAVGTDATDKYGIINKIYKVRSTDGSNYFLNEMSPDSDDSDLVPEEYSAYDTLTFTQTEDVSGSSLTCGSSYCGSADSENTDSYGSSRYWKDVLPDDSVSYVEVHPISSFSTVSDDGFYTGIKGSTGTYTFSGERYISNVVAALRKAGSNGSDVSSKTSVKFISALKEGWAAAKAETYSEVKIFFESTGISALRSSVTALRSIHSFATFASNRRLTTSEFNNLKTLSIDIRKRGCPLYVGEFLVKDSITKETYYSTLMGSVAALLADDMDSYLGGENPSWVKVDSLGGQIDRSVISARWKFTESSAGGTTADTETLDKLGVNPLCLTSDYGVMIESQKTTELNAGDWSMLQHQMAFDLFQREIRDNVMVKLLGKNISDYWIGKAKEWSQPIANKRTAGAHAIWFNAEIYTKTVNNATTRTNRNFVIKAIVKVIPSAEKVTLILENTDQGTVVSAE